MAGGAFHNRIRLKTARARVKRVVDRVGEARQPTPERAVDGTPGDAYRHSALDGQTLTVPTFEAIRHRLLEEVDRILHGSDIWELPRGFDGDPPELVVTSRVHYRWFELGVVRFDREGEGGRGQCS